MLTWMLRPLRRYADFRGRSRRREYWSFMVLVLLVIVGTTLALIVSKGSFHTQAEFTSSFKVWAGFALLPLLVPLLAVSVRRLHDLGLNGWWLLVLPIGAAIPAVDAIVPLLHLGVMALPGRRAPNRFGEDPKAAG